VWVGNYYCNAAMEGRMDKKHCSRVKIRKDIILGSKEGDVY
jgi:hypothetical protein